MGRRGLINTRPQALRTCATYAGYLVRRSRCRPLNALNRPTERAHDHLFCKIRVAASRKRTQWGQALGQPMRRSEQLSKPGSWAAGQMGMMHNTAREQTRNPDEAGGRPFARPVRLKTRHTRRWEGLVHPQPPLPHADRERRQRGSCASRQRYANCHATATQQRRLAATVGYGGCGFGRAGRSPDGQA